MSSGDGWVVVEFNQASHMPRLTSDEVHYTREDAADELAHEQARTAAVGRGETYRIAELIFEEDDE